jgi:hypothetical protein
MGGANKLVQEDPRWGTGSPGDPPHTPSVKVGCQGKEELDSPDPPHLLTHVLFRDREVVKADRLEHEAAVATGLHLMAFPSHTSPALHKGWDRNTGLGVPWALTLPREEGLDWGDLEGEALDTPALPVATTPLLLTVRVGDTDLKGELVMVGEGEGEYVPFKLREAEGTREGVLAHMGDPDALGVGERVNAEVKEGCWPVPLALTLLLLPPLLVTVGVKLGLKLANPLALRVNTGEGEAIAVDDWVGVTEGEPHHTVLLTLWVAHWELVPLPVASPDSEAHCVPLTVPVLLPEARGDAVAVVEYVLLPEAREDAVAVVE